MQPAWPKLLAMLSQRSTWKGIVAILTASGMVLDPARADAIVAGGLTIIGLIQVLIDD